MGTNYYLLHHRFKPVSIATDAVQEAADSFCGPLVPLLKERFLASLPSDSAALHIGKSSAGWCFALRVYPEHGIIGLDDWVPLLEFGRICDENHQVLSPQAMKSIITERSWPERPDSHFTATFLSTNNAVLGPSGLLRSRIDDIHCVGHGPGTWDLMAGDFS